jgi:hypothetical protein
MKRRYTYLVLFGIPGFLVAAIASMAILGAMAGIFWIFVFGDNAWPAWAEYALIALFYLVLLALWIPTLVWGFRTGKRREGQPGSSASHVLISAAIAVALILAAILYEWSVGNIGPKPDSVRCSEFCQSKGYAISSMPPRNTGDRSCNCLDATGHAVLTVPLDRIDASGGR